MEKTLTQVTDYLQSIAHQGNGDKVIKFVIGDKEYDFVGLTQYHPSSDSTPVQFRLESSS